MRGGPARLRPDSDHAAEAACLEEAEQLLAAGAKAGTRRTTKQEVRDGLDSTRTEATGDGAMALPVAWEAMSMSVGAAAAMARAGGGVEPSKAGHVAVVRAPLDAGASVDARRSGEAATRLHRAAGIGGSAPIVPVCR